MRKAKWLPLVACLVVGAFVYTPTAHAGPIFADPLGDTFGADAEPDLDISAISSTLTATDITFEVFFFTPISPASAFALDSVVGYVDIDTDQDPSTGGFPNTTSPLAANAKEAHGSDMTPGSSGLGDEFYADLFSEDGSNVAGMTGFIDIVDTATGLATGAVPITYGAMSLSFTVPLALLGGDDGRLNYGTIVGTFAEFTDEAPNPGAAPASSVPEPGTLTLCAIGGIVGIGYRWRGRRYRSEALAA